MPDISVSNEGTIFLFRPLTDEGREWLKRSVHSEAWQWFGGALSVAHRFAPELAAMAEKDGLTVS